MERVCGFCGVRGVGCVRSSPFPRSVSFVHYPNFYWGYVLFNDNSTPESLRWFLSIPLISLL